MCKKVKSLCNLVSLVIHPFVKALIIEDNISMSLEYEMLLDKLDVEVIGVFKTWREVLPSLKKVRPDFVILDVFLNDNQKGLDFMKDLNDHFIPFIVCTGYPKDEFLEQALLFKSSGFFSKPIDKAALKFKIKSLIQEIEKRKKLNKDYFFKNGQKIEKIPLEEIIYIQIEGNYSTFYVSNGKKYVIKKSLRKLKDELGDNNFHQSHRSCIVNSACIKSINILSNKVELQGGHIVPVGNNYKAHLLKIYEEI